MRKYLLILTVLLCAQVGEAKKNKRVISSEEGVSTTYYFVMPDGMTLAKDFKVTVTKDGTNFVGALHVKLRDGEQKSLQLPCYLLTKAKVLRCVREDGGGRFEISSFVNSKGEKAYRLKVRHLDLGTQDEEPTAISGGKQDEFLEVNGKVVP